MRPDLKFDINSSDKALLENDIVFMYRYSDGCSRNGLRVDLLVKSDFSFEIQMGPFENQSSTGKTFSCGLSGNLPITIWNTIHFLCSQKKLEKHLKHGYGKYMNDIGNNIFKFRQAEKYIQTQLHIIGYRKFS